VASSPPTKNACAVVLLAKKASLTAVNLRFRINIEISEILHRKTISYMLGLMCRFLLIDAPRVKLASESALVSPKYAIPKVGTIKSYIEKF
jgi:hypothetical protein